MRMNFIRIIKWKENIEFKRSSQDKRKGVRNEIKDFDALFQI